MNTPTVCLDRDKKMIKNIYTAVMFFLFMVLLIGGIYLESLAEGILA